MLSDLIRQIHIQLIKRKITVSVAESCTGGLLSSLLTSLPGSSKYFLSGIITYHNKSKEALLRIPAKTIAKSGAVSEEVAKLMARNIRHKFPQSDIGLSITGIAGPDGATAQKPVGTVYICLSAKNKFSCRKLNFSGSRQLIRKKSAQEALRLLSGYLSLSGKFKNNLQ
jgi:nicotinamide-nucleotide amidase